MLIKQLFTGGGDYQRALRQRRWTAAAMAVAGLTGLACYFLLVPSSGLGKFRRFFQGKKYGLRIVRVMAED
ncbi:MAG: hypothetical protein HFF38_11215, partial [Lawsonibacter sp.]|nr:hypothetical protein [Lawsonibacter sp.]